MPTKLIIPVGIPGCGKSTLANTLGAVTISSDLIRRDMHGGEYVHDNDENEEVFRRYHEKLRLNLGEGHPTHVFADATNLQPFAREKLREIAVETLAETHVFFFKNSSEAIVRNEARDIRTSHKVPHDAMLRMLQQYERALVDVPHEFYYSVTYIESVQ